MARMTYEEALANSANLFPDAPITGWNPILETADKPIEAYRIFEVKEAAEVFVNGDSSGGVTEYGVYPGALLSVIKDTSENNGLYHVEPNDSQEVGAPKYKLVKVLTTETGGAGSITVKLKTVINSSEGEGGGSQQQLDPSSAGGEDSKNPYIFFVGVDSSASPQNDVSMMYFNDGVMYDAAGSTILSNSDERLKNIIGPVPVDFDELSGIQKVVFSWKSDKEKKHYIGTIAQSLEEVYPELVTTNPRTNTKMVNYNALAIVSLAAIDKLVERINQLEERVAALEK